MNEYIIGAGAVLTAGPQAGIAGATLHAQTDASIATHVRAMAVDFESSRPSDLSKIVVVAAGWNAGRVRDELVTPLLERQTCSLTDVFATLARSSGAREVHLFARWMPDEVMTAALRREGIELVAHPLEAIRQAALISGQSFSRLPPLAA